MPENLILPSGNKVSKDGQRYRLVGDALITAEMVPIEGQKNQHKALGCQNPKCLENLLTKRATRKKPIIFRCGVHDLVDLGYMPACGNCGEQFTWFDIPSDLPSES